MLNRRTFAVCIIFTAYLAISTGVDAHADGGTIGLAPLATLGMESKSKESKAVERQIAKSLASLPNIKVVSGRKVLAAIKKSKRSELRACDGDAKCLAELGKVLKTDYIVYGEIGGLGAMQVVYLKVVQTSSGKEIRSTTMEVADPKTLEENGLAAAYRLVSPDKYVGKVHVIADITDATIYVDGQEVARSPAEPIDLPVGSHAFRVTHPEFRDDVRFVDVKFNKTHEIRTNLQQFPIVTSDIHKKPGAPKPIIVYTKGGPTPWYRKWYSVAGMSAALFVTSALVVGYLADGTSGESTGTIGDSDITIQRSLVSW